MNKRGSVPIAILGGLMFFIIGMAVMNLLTPEVSTFRIDMECSSAATISDGTKLLCLVGDIAIPYWILIILSISVGGIVATLKL